MPSPFNRRMRAFDPDGQADVADWLNQYTALDNWAVQQPDGTPVRSVSVRTPLGRLDVSRLYAFLKSQDIDYLTGAKHPGEYL